MKFTTTVQQYDNSEDCYIEIPHHILQTLNWEEGDTLDWKIDNQGIILTNTSSTKEKPTMSDYDWYTVKEEAIEEYLNSESEGKDYTKDPDKFYEENYLKATNEETFGSQSVELQKDRPLPPPSNFPHFP